MLRKTTQWVAVPSTPSQIVTAARAARRLATKRAALAAGVSLLPVPGLDVLTDVGLLLHLIPQINQVFGLTPEQIEELAPHRRIAVYKAISAGTGMLVGRVVTRELVLRALQMAGLRLTTQQAAKAVPVAGQLVSAALNFGAMRYVLELHIRQCIGVARALRLPPPSEVVAPPAPGAEVPAASGAQAPPAGAAT